ncbi:MAG: transglycosylase SLT domain-containing protein, partial [Gammaproteobacteria bacterium]|nr:transglycosylase SLT domain-containing protein [Gammaproteobacteria bacterium]
MNYPSLLKRAIPLFACLTFSLTGCATNEKQAQAAPLENPAAHEYPSGESVSLENTEQEQSLTVINTEFPQLDPFQADEDLWQRVRAGYALEHHTDQSRVQSFIDWHQCHPDYLHRVTARGEPYLHMILEEIDARGMPTELVLLPIVESAFVPFAYSHGRAAGIWQFIPSTGRYFGLDQNWWYDGRRDIYASTNAALDYLQKLHKSFDGDWLLALAAYNAGGGNVRKAIRKNKKLGKPTDFWHLDLPKETKFYVPKLLAMSAIVEEPLAYGLSLWPVDDLPYLTKVETNGQIDLAVAAELAELDLDEIYQLNPGFNRWATSPDGPHYLLLPITHAERFSTSLNKLPAEERVTWLRHKIKSGETLSHIATNYHTTTSVLKEANNIRGSNIRAGKYLLVPTSSKPVTGYSLSSTERLKKQQNRKRSGQKIVHVVSNGDTLWDLSREYG